jgi:hypothetical protein
LFICRVEGGRALILSYAVEKKEVRWETTYRRGKPSPSLFQEERERGGLEEAVDASALKESH